jgi:hypothetical protein
MKAYIVAVHHVGLKCSDQNYYEITGCSCTFETVVVKSQGLTLDICCIALL